MAGGVPAIMKELTKRGLLDLSLITATGRTVGENLEGVVNKNPEVVRPLESPYSETGGIAVLWGNIAKNGCVVKRSAVAPEMMVHEGLRACSIPRTMRSRPFTRVRSKRAMWSLSTTKARRAPRHARDAQSDLCAGGHAA